MSGTQSIGASHVQRAQALLQKRERRLVDYWWEYPPPGSKNVMQIGSVDAHSLTQGTQGLVLSYQVPQGFVFRLWAVVFEAAVNPAALPAAGSYPFSGSGRITGVLDLNNPIGGSAIPVGTPVADFSAVTTFLGSMANQPWRVYGRAKNTSVFLALTALNWKVTYNVAVPAAAGEVVINCGLFGWEVPESEIANGA